MAPLTLPKAWAEAAECSASPAAVALGLVRLLESGRSVEGDVLERAVAVMAASRSLTQLLVADPAALSVLAAPDRRPAPDDVVRWKRLEYLRIAACDLTGVYRLEDVGSALAAMADEVWLRAWDLSGPSGVAVIGMGKYGGRELNYASDVDVVFVGHGDVRPAVDLARQCFRVDADLRPEGRSGPLVRSLDAFEAYWERWAETWEFQALLKARPAAGSSELGEAFATAAARAVWQRPFGADEVRAVRAMKARAEDEMARRGLSDRELKRGRGGIRDIEFAVQLLQLVHGRADASLRSGTTLAALSELAGAGYVDRGDAVVLDSAYRFLRMVEHRLQLWDEAQVHAIPASPDALDRLARVCGYRGTPARGATDAFMTDLRRHQAAARAVHERLFFRPLLEAFDGTALMTPAAAADRLAAFGFESAARTGQALAELTRGLTRTSRLMQQVLPLLLAWLSESPDPDAGLLALRTLASTQHRADHLARMFRDSPEGAQRLCLLVGSSRLVSDGLQHHPEVVADLADPKRLEPGQLRTSVQWRRPVERPAALRRMQRYEELRIWIRDLLGAADVGSVSSSLTSLAEAVLAEALAIVGGSDMPIAVIAMGRFGGSELSYASDLDVMVVHDGSDPAGAERVALGLRHLVSGSTPAERIYQLDFDLRPEGKQGALSRSLAGYEEYYRRWAQTWERQALLRGRFAVGSQSVGDAFGAIAEAFLDRALTEADEREIRRVKARIERERIPATDDPDFHLKLGRGGLADVEWTVQLLQMRHLVFGAPGTMQALAKLEAAGHVGAADASALRAAYEYCERTRNRLYLTRGTPGDALPSRPEQLGKLARSLGTTGPELREAYLRVTRRARDVTERLFYGAEGPPRVPTWKG